MSVCVLLLCEWVNEVQVWWGNQGWWVNGDSCVIGVMVDGNVWVQCKLGDVVHGWCAVWVSGNQIHDTYIFIREAWLESNCMQCLANLLFELSFHNPCFVRSNIKVQTLGTFVYFLFFKGIVHPKCCNHLLTLMLFQTCMMNIEDILKNAGNQTFDGPHWLPQHLFPYYGNQWEQQLFGSSKYLLLYLT